MLTLINNRVIGREGNIVLVDSARSRIRRRHAFLERTVCASKAARR
jgi:hypothetical protein